MPKIQIAQDADADEVLSSSSFALLCGMLLDQQFPMEHAFMGPAKVKERFGSLDTAEIAAADPEDFAALCAVPPAVHRYPRSMAGRIQDLARHVQHEYDGDTARLWTEA
ncbi:MAG: HhH-GPD-type base excision DNA repair protein, partial [Nocardioidaceae bacterium]